MKHFKIKRISKYNSIYGNSQKMPKVFKNRYFKNNIFLKGHLNVTTTKVINFFSPILNILQIFPSKTEKQIPTIVNFDKQDKMVRNMNYKNKLFQFKSDFVWIEENVAFEVLKYGLSMKFLYEPNETQDKITITSKGFYFKFDDYFVPLPITFMMGTCVAHEIAIDDNTYDLDITFNHPYFGDYIRFDGQFMIN